ncbi:MAG: DNA repair protein RadC [bacterium]
MKKEETNNLQKPVKDIRQLNGHRERLRDKFMRSGFAGFNDYEVIELLLTVGTPRKDCKAQAKEAIEKFKTIRGVLEASPEELRTIKGIGPGNIFGIKLIQKSTEELFKDRLFNEEIKYGEQIKFPKTLFDYLYSSMGFLEKEQFKVVFFDVKNRILATEDLFEGTINASSVWPREIIESAIKHSAVSVIFAHNHPSGDPNPSPSDRELTKNLVSALKPVDIKVLDHIVIGHNSYFSFAEKSLL